MIEAQEKWLTPEDLELWHLTIRTDRIVVYAGTREGSA
jgi:hypothetical protein